MKDFTEQEKIIVLDFGSQYNQLITRRIREFGVYSELHPHTITVEEMKALNPTGLFFQEDLTVCMTKMPSALTKESLTWEFRFWEFVTACN